MSFPCRTTEGTLVNIVSKEVGEDADGLLVLTDAEGGKWMRRRDADDAQLLEPYDPAVFEELPAQGDAADEDDDE